MVELYYFWKGRVAKVFLTNKNRRTHFNANQQIILPLPAAINDENWKCIILWISVQIWLYFSPVWTATRVGKCTCSLFALSDCLLWVSPSMHYLWTQFTIKHKQIPPAQSQQKSDIWPWLHRCVYANGHWSYLRLLEYININIIPHNFIHLSLTQLKCLLPPIFYLFSIMFVSTRPKSSSWKVSWFSAAFRENGPMI